MDKALKLNLPWEEVKEKIKEIEIGLTDEDLTYTAGEEDQLLNRLAAKMHRSTEEIKAWIESVAFNHGKAS